MFLIEGLAAEQLEMFSCPHGGSRFKRIPTASSSASICALCSAFFVASSIIKMRSLVLSHVRGQGAHNRLFAHLSCWDYLPSSSFPLRSAFNDSRQIKDLDLSAAIFEDPGDGGKCCEGISGYLALRFCNLGEKSGFSDWWEAHKCDSRVPTLADIETGTTTWTGAWCRLKKLSS